MGGYPLLDVTMTGVRARLLAPEVAKIKGGGQGARPKVIEMQRVDVPAMRVIRNFEPGTSNLVCNTCFLGMVGVSTQQGAVLSKSLAACAAPLAETRLAEGVLRQRLADRAKENAALQEETAQLTV